jgi:prepilin-type N-terminal cleavage/methylation domain-containing protein
MKRLDSGLTLLELLVGLAIMGMMAVIISQALNLGIRAWEKGDSLTNSEQVQPFDWQIISRQIRSIYPAKSEKNQVFFKADKSEMSFVSAFSLRMGDRIGMVRVIYRLERDSSKDVTRLLVYEEPLISPERLEEKVNKDDFIQLAKIPGRVSFSYEKASPTSAKNTGNIAARSFSASSNKKDGTSGAKDKNTEVDTWDEDSRGLPVSVTIDVSSSGSKGADGENKLIIPIMVRGTSKIG